jgi:hypothetical protein
VVIALTFPMFRGRIRAIVASNGSNGTENKYKEEVN